MLLVIPTAGVKQSANVLGPLVLGVLQFFFNNSGTNSTSFAGFFVFFFFSFLLTDGPCGSKSFRHLRRKNTPDLLRKIHVYSWGESLPELLKEILNIEF